MDPILHAQDLKVSYGRRVAVKDLSFTVAPGEIVGFLGPNGAGKTSAIRALTTILAPTAGAFSVVGIPHTQPEEIRRRIGVLPESHGYPAHVTALEHLTTYGQLHGMRHNEAEAQATRLLRDVGLARRARGLVSRYSRGMRQRLGIARALLNDPAVVFLDEPTLGLDPRGQEELMAIVRWIANERGAGVVLCSHLLDEVEAVCDRVVILQDGEVVASGTVADVTEASGQVVRIHVAPGEAPTTLIHLPDADDMGGGWLRIRLGRDERANRALAALVAADIEVRAVAPGRADLHQAFLRLTEAMQ